MSILNFCVTVTPLDRNQRDKLTRVNIKSDETVIKAAIKSDRRLEGQESWNGIAICTTKREVA